MEEAGEVEEVAAGFVRIVDVQYSRWVVVNLEEEDQHLRGLYLPRLPRLWEHQWVWCSRGKPLLFYQAREFSIVLVTIHKCVVPAVVGCSRDVELGPAFRDGRAEIQVPRLR